MRLTARLLLLCILLINWSMMLRRLH
jgi:uncharacterized membrane protein YhaH (DUF805 family)